MRKRYVSAVLCARLANAAKNGRGEGAFKPRKSKRDKGLQARIETVVKHAALSDQFAGHGVDVMYDARHTRIVCKGVRVG